MGVETIWIIALVAVVVAAVVGYFVGRSGHAGAQERITELETEAKRRKEEFADYKKEVETHFDKSASLFVDMAGSYKALFEHLSSDYEKLSEGSARELFKERVGALLMEGDAPKALADKADASSETSSSEAAQKKPTEPVAADATAQPAAETASAKSEAEAPKAKTTEATEAAKSENTAGGVKAGVTVTADAAADAAAKEATIKRVDTVAESAAKEVADKPAETVATDSVKLDTTDKQAEAKSSEAEAKSSESAKPEAETTLEKASRKRSEDKAAAAKQDKA